MMLDDGLRFCSADSLVQDGNTVRRIGSTMDLHAITGSTTNSADPFGATPMGVFIRWTTTMNDGAGFAQGGLLIVAHPLDTAASAVAASSPIIGASEPLMGSQFTSLFPFRAYPAAGDDAYIALIPLLQRTAQTNSVHTGGLTYNTPDSYPRYLSMVCYTSSAGGIGYTAGAIDAWLTDRVPTMARSTVDLSSYN